MNTKRFRIAFSFAGEKRAFVAKVAAILAKRFGKDAILYDKFFEAAFAQLLHAKPKEKPARKPKPGLRHSSFTAAPQPPLLLRPHRGIEETRRRPLAELNRLRNGADDPFSSHVWLHAGLDPVDIPATARDRYRAALAEWQMKCVPPRPGAALFAKPKLLADFRKLCAASRHCAP